MRTTTPKAPNASNKMVATTLGLMKQPFVCKEFGSTRVHPCRTNRESKSDDITRRTVSANF
jgi:hypothetical protein